VSFTFPVFLLIKKAVPIKNGREKIILRVNKVKASTCVSANAFFTIIAFVENITAPMKVIRKPRKEMFFFNTICISRKSAKALRANSF
jgi:hypothetical protein